MSTLGPDVRDIGDLVMCDQFFGTVSCQGLPALPPQQVELQVTVASVFTQSLFSRFMNSSRKQHRAHLEIFVFIENQNFEIFRYSKFLMMTFLRSEISSRDFDRCPRISAIFVDI